MGDCDCIQVTKSAAWKLEFEILLNLSKEHPAFKFEVKHTRKGGTLLTITTLEMRDSILKIVELEKSSSPGCLPLAGI